nr:sodium-dependent proline transporter-like [Aedes albopictus]
MRGSWASKTEFILSCLGYAIGIGNVWRFPYLCYRNGGGAFLIPYLIMLVFCGIPLFFLEVSLGQFSGRGCVTVFQIAPLLKGAGLAIVLCNFVCVSYCNVIMAYSLLFLWNSLRSRLPWMNCGNKWNTERCLELGGQGSLIMNASARWRTSADEFFHNAILHISDGIDSPGGIVWPLFFSNLIAWIFIYAYIINGVKSVGKVVYFTATFPFVVLAVLFVRGITLPGAVDGIRFYILPQWSQLTNLEVWSDAAIQIFFSLGPGWGGLVNMASYNRFKNNTKTDSVLIPIVNSGTSIFAGFVVFSALGYLSYQTGLPVSTVATGGPGLVFITYPEAIAMLPFPQLWACLFFMMLFFLGVDTIFVQVETIVSAVLDELPRLRRHRRLFTAGLCFVMFLLSSSCTTQVSLRFLLELKKDKKNIIKYVILKYIGSGRSESFCPYKYY